MGHITVTQDLPVASDKLWATISDPQTWEAWLTIHAGWLEEPPATLAEGAKLVEKVVMLGMANKLEWTVTKVDAGRELAINGTGMAGVTSSFVFTLEPNGESTKVSIDAEFQGSLIVGALGKAVEKDANQNLSDSLEKLVAAAA
ncbi:SRPBCC family protein [Nocardioides sp. WS12]|uniref:type II toxin-antitoxin system Rv0910 family toxin n=1 Tax=Nocardioides sp. WS12 TaxID=2486272 RepID=UPI0015FAC644|nr:SRPBCC family protein [Nocardioides sp. WS12]